MKTCYKLPSIHKLRVLSQKSSLFFFYSFLRSTYLYKNSCNWFTDFISTGGHDNTHLTRCVRDIWMPLAATKSENTYALLSISRPQSKLQCQWSWFQLNRLHKLSMVANMKYECIYLLNTKELMHCDTNNSVTVDIHGNQKWDQMPVKSQHPLIGEPHTQWIRIQRTSIN